MQKIIPFIWFEDQAQDAAAWYVSLFPQSRILSSTTLPGTPSGDTQIVTMSLWGTEFQCMSAGQHSLRNPSFSYMVACSTEAEVEELWGALSVGAEILLPLEEYPFSRRYGWLKDKYGVSWQIMHDGGMPVQRIAPCLLFVGDVCGRAEAAMTKYCSLFPGSALLPGHLSRYGDDQPPNVAGTLDYARFTLTGLEVVVMDSALDHKFAFNEMQSLVVRCTDQAEMDFLWEKLSHVPAAEQCGWLKDEFGVSWQMSSAKIEEYMNHGTREQIERMVQAFLPMKKLDMAKIEEAYREK